MKSLKLCLLLCICYVSMCFSSDCRPQSKLELYKRADIILIGKVKNITDSLYTVEVVETFKGKLKEELIGVITNDTRIPKQGWTLLIYGTFSDGNYFIADVCSGTKSFEIPYSPHNYSNIILPPKEVYLNPVGSYLSEQVSKNRSLDEMWGEIQSLRVMSQQKKKLDQAKELLNKISILNNEIKFLWCGILLVIAFNSVLIIIILKKK